jgi:hypothetical protein
LIALGPVLERLLEVLDRLEIPFLIGGSVASGSYGLPRQTNDIDVIADFRNADMPLFCELLHSEFYLDEQSAVEAIKQGRPFNTIHLKGAFKFDFFPASSEGFTQSELTRKRYIISAMPGLENIEFPISSPEDTVLAKLVWFRKGGEVSDRQWNDILGVLGVQFARLDHAYMEDWAAKLNVSDLLETAIRTYSGGS